MQQSRGRLLKPADGSKRKAGRPRKEDYEPPQPWEALSPPLAERPAPGKKPYRSKKLGKATMPEQERHQASDETRKMIANMASYGLDVLMISKLAGIAVQTIYRHYRHEMQTAAAQKDLVVLQTGFLKAIGGPAQDWEKADAGMIKWWIAARQNWQLPAQRTINANFNMNMDLSRLSDEQLDELERIMEAAAMDAGTDQAGEGGPLIEADIEPDRG